MRRALGLCSVFGLVAALGVVLSGCATSYPTGLIYTELKLPVTATEVKAPAPKTGVSTCTSILCLIALGDASIDAAAKAGGITEIMSVDWEAKNILGIYGEYKCTVRGK